MIPPIGPTAADREVVPPEPLDIDGKLSLVLKNELHRLLHFFIGHRFSFAATIYYPEEARQQHLTIASGTEAVWVSRQLPLHHIRTEEQ